MAIYTVFDEESEFAAQKCQILEPGGKNQENLILEKFLLLIFFNLNFFKFEPRVICFFGQSSAPWSRIDTNIGGHSSYKPPRPFYNLRGRRKQQKTQIFRTKIVETK